MIVALTTHTTHSDDLLYGKDTYRDFTSISLLPFPVKLPLWFNLKWISFDQIQIKQTLDISNILSKYLNHFKMDLYIERQITEYYSKTKYWFFVHLRCLKVMKIRNVVGICRCCCCSWNKMWRRCCLGCKYFLCCLLGSRETSSCRTVKGRWKVRGLEFRNWSSWGPWKTSCGRNSMANPFLEIEVYLKHRI